MNRLTGLDREFYYETHGAFITALTERVDQLHDGRLPRIRAVSGPGEPAELVEGLQTATSVARHVLDWEGVALDQPEAVQCASLVNGAERRVADVMITATVDLTRLGRGISTEGIFLRELGIPQYIRPATYEYASWTKVSLRTAGGYLAMCSAVQLGDRNPENNNANYQIIVDNNTTRQTLMVAVVDGDFFSTNLAVESSQDLLYRECQSLVGDDTTQELLAGDAESRFEVAERVSIFLAEQRSQKADWVALPSAAQFVRRIHQRAQAVRQARQELAMHVDLPTRRALTGFCQTLSVRV